MYKRDIFVFALLCKLSFFAVIVFSYFLLPFNNKLYHADFIYPKNEKVSLVTIFQTWDAQHYLYLSQQGYKLHQESNRFFPLLPFLIFVGNIFIKNPIIVGLIVSNICSLLATLYLYKFTFLLTKNDEISFLTGIFLLVFPTSFYLNLIYSESILLFFIIAGFYYLYSQKFIVASIFLFFVPLTRPTGLFILLPIAVYYYHLYKNMSFSEGLIEVLKKKAYFCLLLPLLGYSIYLLLMYLTTGSPFIAYQEAGRVIGNWSIWNILNPIIFLSQFVGGGQSLVLHGFTNSILDRVFFILYCLSLILIYKKLDKTLFFYALVMGMVPFFGTFMSYTRYLLMVFPVFIVLAIYLQQKKYFWFSLPLIYLSILLQALFSIMHTLNYWVA